MKHVLLYITILLLLIACENPAVNLVIPEPFYTVSFETQGGTPVSAQSIRRGQRAHTPEASAKDGFTFGGWFTGTAYEHEWNFNTTVSADTTLYARWDKIPNGVYYLVSLYDPMESADIPLTEWEAAEKTLIVAPEMPEKKGYNPGCWYTEHEDEEGNMYTTAWDFAADIVCEDTQLYIQWNPISYDVAYNKNDKDMQGKALAGIPAGDMEEDHYRYDDGEALALNEFGIAGYTFIEWNTAADGSGVSWADAAAGNISATDGERVNLYAQWAANRYYVTFDPYGGNWPQSDGPSLSLKTERPAYNEPVANPGDPKKELPAGLYRGSLPGTYPFGGWYRDTAYTEEWDFTDGRVPDNDITLYARWTDEELVDDLYDAEADPNGNVFYSDIIQQSIDYIEQHPGAYTLLLDEDVISDGYVMSEAGCSLTLVGSGGERKIRISYNGGMLFDLSGKTSLTLGENITLEGITAGVNGAQWNNSDPLVNVQDFSVFTMLEHSKITGNTVELITGIDFAGQGVASAVLVGLRDKGNSLAAQGKEPGFVMKGGEITGNSIEYEFDLQNLEYFEMILHSAVLIHSRSQALLEGGSIGGNYLMDADGNKIPADLSMTTNTSYSDLYIKGSAVVDSLIMEVSPVDGASGWRTNLRITGGWQGEIKTLHLAGDWQEGESIVSPAPGTTIGAAEIARIGLGLFIEGEFSQYADWNPISDEMKIADSSADIGALALK